MRGIKGGVLMTLSRFLLILRTIKNILDGRVVIIEDKGGSFKTFVGNEVGKDRFNLFLLNSIYQLREEGSLS
jgi:hypothetical protein